MWDLDRAQELKQAGHSFRSIGAALGIPAGTVIGRMSRGNKPRQAWVSTVEKMLRNGASIKDAAAAVGVGVYQVRKVMKTRAEIEVPSWVPLGLRKEYVRIARDFDEFEAARWARAEMPARSIVHGSSRPGADAIAGLPAPVGSEMSIINSVLGPNETFEMVVGRGKDRATIACRARVVVALHRRGFSASHIGRLLNRDHSGVLKLVAKYNENGEKIR